MWLGPLLFGLLFLLLMVIIAGGFEPFLFIPAVIVLIISYVGRRFPRRAGLITVLVGMTLLILLNIQFVVDDVSHPEAFVNFSAFGVAPLVFALVGIISSIAVLRSMSDAGASRFAYGAAGVVVLAVVVSGAITLGLENDAAAAGDIRIVAEEVEFMPSSASGSGTVGVFIENKDPIRHTFTIEALDIEVSIPGNMDRRVEISAPAGTYTFVCKVPGHEDMTGTLTIEG